MLDGLQTLTRPRSHHGGHPIKNVVADDSSFVAHLGNAGRPHAVVNRPISSLHRSSGWSRSFVLASLRALHLDHRLRSGAFRKEGLHSRAHTGNAGWGSNLAHRRRRLCSPVDEDRFTAFLRTLPVPAAPYAVDLGCGKGEALRLVHALYGGAGTGVDVSARMLGEANESAASIEFVQADAAGWRPDRMPDFVVCMGSTHIFGGIGQACRALAELVRPGGVALVEHGYWRSNPAAEDLEAFGMETTELTDLDQMVEQVEGQDLVPVDVQPSTQAEWDDYEWSLIRSVELWAMANPQNPDFDAFVARTRMMRQSFLKWRRAATGFALVGAVKMPRR